MYKSMADRQWNISTHSAHEDGDSDNDRLNGSLTISTHSAHEDGDF